MKILIKNINLFNMDEYKNMYSLIKAEKAKKIDKIYDKKIKQSSILGEYLFILGLKKFYNIDYNKVIISYNKNNKPYINNYPLFFNISHSENYVIVVFSNKEIGVDIQKQVKSTKSFYDYIITENDKKIIPNLPQNNPISIFCLKESYIKMLGKKIGDIKNIEIENILKNNIKFINAINDYIIVICEKKMF